VPTVLCTGPRTAAQLLAPHAPGLARAITTIDLTALVSLTAFFPRSADDVRGFGVLFPRNSGIEAYGVLFGADVFPSRSRLRSETWIYGAPDRDALLARAGSLVHQVLDDRRVFTTRDVPPVAIYAGAADEAPADRSIASVCAELPLYGTAIAGVRDRLEELPPWLAVAGNYVGHLGISKLLDVSAGAVARILRAKPAASA
jgi:hypothetical protein